MFHMEQKEEPRSYERGLFFLLRNCSFYDKVENVCLF